SDKLKPFWLSIHDENLSSLDQLSNILLTGEPTAEYREAVTRALDIHGCRVVPFFGSFLRDLRSILSGIPSIVVFPSDESKHLECVSDYNGEDRFMTRIGVGGLINLEKISQSHVVLNDIHLFHERAKSIAMDKSCREAFCQEKGSTESLRGR
ncbi:hypothetical protein CAPTEDRAFT_107584, partial [Capitella teleta]|uniref:Ras-GEF domain-containing protein n=1 Tax=Capitella teleta TaxID=283909 RepID=X1YTY8_CAPTE